MPSYEFDLGVPSPSPFGNGFVQDIHFRPAKNVSITKVEAKLSSGNATCNVSQGLPDVDVAVDTDDLPEGAIHWMMRSEDLGSAFSDTDTVDSWYAHPSSAIAQSYKQTSSTNRPSYYADQDGLGYQSNPNDNPCVYFNGFTSMLNHHSGESDIDYDQSWTLVTAIGKKNAGSYRGVIGTESSGSIQSLYGDWGRHRTRQGIFSGGTREYAHSTALLAHDQIRVMTVEYNTNGRYYINEWINGTLTYGPVNFQYGSGPWVFDMLGAAQYVAGTNTYFLRFSGGISEIWLINGEVDTTERQNIEGAIAHKYGSKALLPSTHPHYTDDPNPSAPTMLSTSDVSLTSSYQDIFNDTVNTLSTAKGSSALYADRFSVFCPKVQNPGTLTIRITTS